MCNFPCCNSFWLTYKWGNGFFHIVCHPLSLVEGSNSTVVTLLASFLVWAIINPGEYRNATFNNPFLSNDLFMTGTINYCLNTFGLSGQSRSDTENEKK